MWGLKNRGNELFNDIVSKKAVPMLLDYKPFQELIKYGASDRMKSYINDLKVVIMEEKRKILEVNNLQKEKSVLPATILYYSDMVNNKHRKEDEKILEEKRQKLIEITDNVDRLENEIKELLKVKEDLNLNLLKETVDYCYKTINTKNSEYNKVLVEIEQMRKKLEKARVKRDSLKNLVDSTYGFIHGFMGASKTQKIDDKLLKDNEEL